MNVCKFNLTLLAALFSTFCITAYDIKVLNNTRRKIEVHADFAGISGAVKSKKMEPFKEAKINPGLKLDCLRKLVIISFGKYATYDKDSRKASDYVPHTGPQEIYRWNGLICGDQKIEVIESNRGAKVKW